MSAPTKEYSNAPTVPALRQPKVPALRQPKVPALTQPKIPALRQTKVPALRQPKVPALTQPKVPALRQPKFVTRSQENPIKKKCCLPDVQYVIVTLKDKQKLVVSSDAYHGIITMGNTYKCVFCSLEMKLDSSFKEGHKNSKRHLMLLEKYPPAEKYAENLIRKLTEDSSFCTICNVPLANVHLQRHLRTEVHTQELQKAEIRAITYKPS